MNSNAWIIITDERRAGGMLDAARRLGGRVTAAVVGSSTLAASIAALSFDRVLCFETGEVPVEAYGEQVAATVAAEAPGVILSSDAAASRVLLGAAAAKLNAVLLSSVRVLAVEGDLLVVSRATAEGKVLEDIEVAGALAAIFDGDDVETLATAPVPVEPIAAGEGANFKLLETIKSEDDGGLLTAARIVGVGRGVKTKNDLHLIEELTAALHAETACTLPVCDDMRWFPSSRVVGSSHSQAAPELYIGVGVSGQPQHMSGIRDAKIVVAINNDPEARIFKHCDYGILGDLYEVVPALVSAFKKIG